MSDIALKAARSWALKALLDAMTVLMNLGLKRAARPILDWATPHLEADRKTMDIVSRAFNGLPSNARITQLRLQRLNEMLVRPLSRKNYPRLLWLIARFEILEKNIPVKLGDMIARQMVSEPGRRRIHEAAAQVLDDAPNSAFVAYLYAVTLAKDGDYQKASLVVRRKIETLAEREFESEADMKAAKRQFDMLRNAWRVVDQIAREDTGWLDDESGGTYADLVVKTKNVRARARTEGWSLNFKEPLLQARDEQGYLDACRTEFERAGAALAKMRVIQEMLRQGVRRQLTFHRAYELANRSFDTLRDELLGDIDHAAVAKMPEKAAVELVQTLNSALDICRTLQRKSDIDAIKTRMLELAHSHLHHAATWLLMPSLVREDEDVWGRRSQVVVARLPRPAKGGELRAYLQWALHMRQFKEAERLFSELPSSMQSNPAALYFVNILQRQSRFTDALRLIKRIHAVMLAKPAQLNPFQHWSLVRRYGELSFLRHTANAFHKVPQPKKPKGVIIIAPRNIDQLRKYPLVVLMELKRQGWAIIPLVEGLLPRELTDDPRIDLLNGCITVELGLRPAAKRAFRPIKGFVAEPSKGEFHCMDLNLKHSMWEDARINRRAFDVDFSCPALSNYLQRLCDWTELVAQATVYAHGLFPALKMRCGLMSLFNSRLPDSIFRFFCDQYGDEHNFFCLQAANGYENYFKNFSTQISTRCVIRNVTRDRLVRSASLPNPPLFDRYFDAHKHKAAEIIAMVEEQARVRQSTVKVAQPEQAALDCEQRIMEWRAGGGKVACLFGKVVCDSAVPFDGGPAHKDLKDWLSHSIEAVRGSNTMLLIKPHPHELNEQIATYLNQYFTDLIEGDLPENVIILGHRWFNIAALERFVDLGSIYNGTTAIEMALLEIPCILCNHFAPSDYHVGHVVPKDREHYEAMLRFEVEAKTLPDARARAAVWLEYMSNGHFAIDYRYHTRPITNKVIYPPFWVEEDLKGYLQYGDPNVKILAARVTGAAPEPGGAQDHRPWRRSEIGRSSPLVAPAKPGASAAA